MTAEFQGVLYADFGDPLTSLPWWRGCDECAGLIEAVQENGPMATILQFIAAHFERDHGTVVRQGDRTRAEATS